MSVFGGAAMGTMSVIKARLAYLWRCFSKPVPASPRELLTLLLLCLLIAMVTGALLFAWLSGAELRYPLRWSAVTACVCGVCVFLLLTLIHPLRCVLAIMLPTLGCSQGQRLVLSVCVLLTLLSAPPNIANNVSTLTHTLKCTSENVVRSLLNSSDVMNAVKGDLVSTVAAYDAMSSYVQSLHSFDHVTHVNVSMVTQRFRGVARRLEGDFRKAQGQLRSLKVTAHRLLAAILVLHLLWSAGRYLTGYLTALHFDNDYVTHRLRRVATARGLELHSDWLRGGVRLSGRERWECVSPLVIVTLHLLLCVTLMTLDLLVYRVVRYGTPWLLDIPDTNITLSVHYKLRWCVIAGCLVMTDCCSDALLFQKAYDWPITVGAGQCQATPSAPDGGLLVVLSVLFLLSYGLVILQVYARRVRRAVAASFYPCHEDRRTDFLFQKILSKQTADKTALFTIATAAGDYNRKMGPPS